MRSFIAWLVDHATTVFLAVFWPALRLPLVRLRLRFGKLTQHAKRALLGMMLFHPKPMNAAIISASMTRPVRAPC